MKSNFLSYFFIILIILIVFANIIQCYNTSPNISMDIIIPNFHFSNDSSFSWPLPGFHNITSNFGNRIHPLSNKLSSHDGIDISAPPGTYIYSASSGIVTFADYNGANGYSVHILYENLEFIYGHVSPEFIVSVGSEIKENQIIATVGPKYINGKLNGSTTGPHLHFSIKKDGIAVNPLDFI